MCTDCSLAYRSTQRSPLMIADSSLVYTPTHKETHLVSTDNRLVYELIHKEAPGDH